MSSETTLDSEAVFRERALRLGLTDVDVGTLNTLG